MTRCKLHTERRKNVARLYWRSDLKPEIHLPQSVLRGHSVLTFSNDTVMHIQLSFLRTLVVSSLNPENTMLITQADMNQFTQELPTIREFLHEAMRLEVFSSVNDRVIERHIQQVQKDCIDLMNIMHGYTGLSDLALELYHTVFSCLEQVLRHIEKHHSRFFNLKAELPNGYFIISLEDISQKKKLLRALFKKHGVSAELQKIVMDSVAYFLKRDSCTYDELLYFKDLIESILLLEPDENDFETVLKEHLLYYRFNSINYQKYYLRTIADELSRSFDQQEKYELLCRYEKQFREQQERACSNFVSTCESIKFMLLDFVKAEIKFLHRKQMSFFSSYQGRRESMKSTYRLKVSLSVDGLAYLIRLMVEAGVILSSSKSELLTFISEHIQTPGIDEMKLSVKSLNNKYKQVVQATINAVRAALMKMLKILEAY